jgi:hypothetical protein
VITSTSTPSGAATMKCRWPNASFLAASIADDTRRIVLIDAPAVLGWHAWRGHDAAGSGRLLDDVLRDLAGAGEIGSTPVEAASALPSGR